MQGYNVEERDRINRGVDLGQRLRYEKPGPQQIAACLVETRGLTPTAAAVARIIARRAQGAGVASTSRSTNSVVR